MAIARVHTWSAGEVLLAADLNSEFSNILNNGSDLVSPFTKAISMGGFALNFDAANTIALTATTSGITLTGGTLREPAEDTITAFATGGQTNATALSAAKKYHRISVCATVADSVKLPSATAGQAHFVRNDGAASAQVYGTSPDTINGIATGTGVVLPTGAGCWFVCTTAAAWASTMFVGGNMVGGINDAKTTVVSTTTPDIFSLTVGNVVDYTGTTTCTGFVASPQAGARRTLICAGAAPFTAGANMLIDGFASGSTFTAVAGDAVDVIAVTTTQFRLKPRLYTNAAIFTDISTCDFRLTVSTGTPVTTSDVTAAGTLFASPYTGNRIALFDGTSWNTRTSAEFSLALTLTSGKPYDIFCFDNSGVPALEALVWTNDTTRATALTLQNGVLVKTGVTTRRYLGTIYASGANTTEDSVAKRYVWNYYNRKWRPMRRVEATDSWTYTLATLRQANNAAANQLDFVVGVSEDAVVAEVMGIWFSDQAASAVQASVGIGLDSTTVNSATRMVCDTNHKQNNHQHTLAWYEGFPSAGRHTMPWLEQSTALGTTTWFGDNGQPSVEQAGIVGRIFG